MPYRAALDPNRKPKTSYTDADLKDFEDIPFSVTTLQPPTDENWRPELEGTTPGYGPHGLLGPVDPNAAIAGMKAALANANAFDNEISQPPLSEDEKNFILQHTADPNTLYRSQVQPSVMDTFSDRLGKMMTDFKRRHDYAMSQPVERYTAPLAKAIAAPLVLMGSGGLAAATSGLSLAERGLDEGVQGYKNHPIATALDVAGVVTPALHSLSNVVNESRATRAAAQSARDANQAERELVDSYAAQRLQRRPYSAQEQITGKQKMDILRKAHEDAGRVHGEVRLNSQQVHPEYPNAPDVSAALRKQRVAEVPTVNSGIDELAGANQSPATAARYGSVTPNRSVRGLRDALKPNPDDLESFAQGEPITGSKLSAGRTTNPLFDKAMGGGEKAENLNAAINTTDVRPRSSAQGLMNALKKDMQDPNFFNGEGNPEMAGSQPYSTNASGESMASQEAMNRQASMKSKGEQFVVIDRAGNMRPLIGPEAVDYTPRPGEKYGTFSKNGFKLLQEGGKRAARR